jgi:hypothetical protein
MVIGQTSGQWVKPKNSKDQRSRSRSGPNGCPA